LRAIGGLFVVETLVREPDLFDTYIALDPSLWRNDGALLKQVSAHPVTLHRPKNLYIGSSADGRSFIDQPALAATFGKTENLHVDFESWPTETHATIYHPAALKALLQAGGKRPSCMNSPYQSSMCHVVAITPSASV